MSLLSHLIGTIFSLLPINCSFLRKKLNIITINVYYSSIGNTIRIHFHFHFLPPFLQKGLYLVFGHNLCNHDSFFLFLLNSYNLFEIWKRKSPIAELMPLVKFMVFSSKIHISQNFIIQHDGTFLVI